MVAGPAGAPAPSPLPPVAAPSPAAPSAGAAPLPPEVSGPPPGYYIEAPSGAPPGTMGPGEPPLPILVVEPPPPPEPSRAVPRTAFWAGARLGWLAPFGSLWVDGYGYEGGGALYYRRRAFTEYASAGPATEIDVGVRLSRSYNVFALWEHGFLGTGSLDSQAFGGQDGGESNLYGVGLRFSTDPGAVGFMMEVALGYRDFRASWADGTELRLSDGWMDARLGLGADIRLARWLSLTPLVTLGGGSFGSAEWSGPEGTRDAHTALDNPAEYGFAGVHVGAHVDLD